MSFWIAMGLVAFAIVLFHVTRAKEVQWHEERLQRWEDFKAGVWIDVNKKR